MDDTTTGRTARGTSTAHHWGTMRVIVRDGRVVHVDPYEGDTDPAAMVESMAGTIDGPQRIQRPHARAGWLEAVRAGADPAQRQGARRGADRYVPIDWEEAFELAAAEISRIREAHGNEAIYAGSYGWASAGRFHHAQSQIHRFYGLAGGYVKSVNAYSYAAAEVILPHVIASLRALTADSTSWPSIAENAELMVAFGGLPLKNAQNNAGGLAKHTTHEWMERCAENGMRFVSIAPFRDDTPDFVDPEWAAIRPNSDTALMLALAHVLEAEGLADHAFLDRYCVGYDRFRPYLMGEGDGIAKSPEWAAPLCGMAADAIRDLARRMASHRTIINVSWSLQRAEHGEQPYWMAVVLAAMLGQIGTPGGGLTVGLSALHGVGDPSPQSGWGALPQGRNPVKRFIPVARIADMLLDPGGSFDYDGQSHRYPDIRLVHWAGGNPFHHHQDLNRLRRAWARPETVIVNEIFWNSLARHADLVLPATTAMERNDYMATSLAGHAVAMKRAVDPVGEARDDYAIFTGIAGRLGIAEAFTEGRDEMAWLRHLWDISRQRGGKAGFEIPEFDSFWEREVLELPGGPVERVFAADFRADPEAHPLKTPSGRIEIFSERIAGFDYDDCPGHPVWIPPREWLGATELAARYPLHLISNQPRKRLHSQLDHGKASTDAKIKGREPCRLNPADAAARGIAAGDIVRLFNDRGACLAGAMIDEGVMPGVVELATGAWYDPVEPEREGSLDAHGNPNVLTADIGTSRLAQGPSAHSALVEVERVEEDEAPPVRAFAPPL
ncbi:molybdopterin guanine dinucleotide-containing S/N-oxide reductase [Marivibrio halodurans]|uniref:Molybdopterin guanine dinucleotide-containing S/N-oxide reductase n=1 Tax=Marivibrio halodurans TaxID=2039722 RepID=A0A8J7RWH7_9PROT|nr:molybdopterin guanine dinucleotide-containing S/N-oxide reductase [Marivibrio halodurans]MBP5855992.1 molybdopterin guanine dinucleotide-containing S/N-oxide reductase [Marivibrio halodurans]